MDTTQVPETAHRRVRLAARAIGRAHLAHAYGHCSQRLDARHFLVSPARPMGLIGTSERGVVVPVDGPLPAGVLGEVRIHQQIYLRRADVGGIVRFQSPYLMTLSTLGRTPLPRHGFGAYFAPGVPLWRDPRLLRNDESSRGLADQLGAARAILMRGNGAVSVATTLEEATVLAWYLEDAARVELEVLASGQPGELLSPEEAADRAVTDGRLFERMWEYLTAGDPEAEAENESGDKHER
jgi:HCOMODA/2-hydroxy-3-carboxy-muconic semialdehyde decarboxylase